MTTRKARVRELLTLRDYDSLMRWSVDDRGTRRILQSFTFDADELVRWRAIEAMGKLARLQAESDIEKVRDLVRRFFWLMSDESGGLGWHSPELIGEILVNVPELIDEFATLLPAYLREEPFERGTHFAVYRVATVDPSPFANIGSELHDSLKDADPAIRGLAALALCAIGAELCREAAGPLKGDTSGVMMYDFDTGRMRATTVEQMAAGAVEQAGSAETAANDRWSTL